jgi:hypothetical protein
MSHQHPPFAPALATLLASAPLNELGPGREVLAAQATLVALTPARLVSPREVASTTMGQACLAGLWLRFDFLNASHEISQGIENPTGSFWHAIMHRREPDCGNAKYWFRRVGQHPIFSDLAARAKQLAEHAHHESVSNFLRTQTAWDPYQFVDLCEEAYDAPHDLRTLCQQVQLAEWELLFDYCYALACGK